MQKANYIFSIMLILQWKKKKTDKMRFYLGQLFSQVLEFHCVCHFYISRRPCICSSPAYTTGERSRMSLLWTRHGGEEGKWRNHQKKWYRWWSWGLTRGRLQGWPAPRQMCLGVTPHLQPKWINQQMFNVKARLSRQPKTHMHTPATQRHAYTHSKI